MPVEFLQDSPDPGLHFIVSLEDFICGYCWSDDTVFIKEKKSIPNLCCKYVWVSDSLSALLDIFLLSVGSYLLCDTFIQYHFI